MTMDWEEFPIICRPALPKDTADVFKLTKHIWEGEDYVPKVWSQWLSDPQGLLAVAESRAMIVGLGKLSQLASKEWWLEGLRVDPQFEGHGIASRLNSYLNEYWQRNCSGVIRMATSSKREPVKHLAQKLGYYIVGELSVFESAVLNDQLTFNENKKFSPLKNGDIETAISFIQDPGKVWHPSNLLDIGWQWATPQLQHLEKYVKDEQIWWWRDREGILIQVDKREDAGLWARIRLIACGEDHLQECLDDTRRFAARRGYDRLIWLAPLIKGSEEIIVASGFERTWDSSLLIFEKKHPRS